MRECILECVAFIAHNNVPPSARFRSVETAVMFSSKFHCIYFLHRNIVYRLSERSVSIVFHAVTLSMNFHLVEAALSMKLRSAIHKENTLEWLIS